ncbi:hypothetical protein HBI26_167120 [Parastagonospora nodorum]|nr:hypothetical protein HBI26_167120 [Parastagonospora nodorum]
MLSAHRYVAYTSDISESFRPVAHPYWVRGAYGGYKAYIRNQRTLHPESYIEVQENNKGAELTASPPKSIFESVKDVAKQATNTEGVKISATPGALTGKHVTPSLIPAIEDYRAVMAQRAVFQAVASIGLPAFTIHSIIRYSRRAIKDAKNKTLAAVPFLPYIFNEPTFSSKKAVEGRPVTSAKKLRKEESQSVNRLRCIDPLRSIIYI